MSSKWPMISAQLCAALLLVATSCQSSFGQTDPANFQTVINIPSEEISTFERIESNTQINLSEFGSIGDSVRLGLAEGGSENIELNVTGGTVGSRLLAFEGSTVNISGGEVGTFFQTDRSNVNITGGNIGFAFRPNESNVTMSGGTVNLSAPGGIGFSGSRVHVSGGFFGGGTSGFGADARIWSSRFMVTGGVVAFENSIDNVLDMTDGVLRITNVTTSHFRVFGGQVDANSFVGTRLREGSSLILAGGVIASSFNVDATSSLRLVGTDFFVDGVPVAVLPGGLVEIADRDVTLTGTLNDGTAFSLDLPSEQIDFADPFFDPNASIAVATPGEFDIDEDGDVDGGDVDFYSGNFGLAAEGDLALLDLDEDGFVTAADHEQFVMTHVQTADGAVGTFLGDVDLDGTVSVTGDAFVLVRNLGNPGPWGYADGDLNADGKIDVLGDAFTLVTNLGRTNMQ